MTEYSKIIKLNVGGTHFQTSLHTLQTNPDSYLGHMFGSKFHSTPNENGEYFIDASGEMFKYILDYLRRGRLMLPEDFKEYDLLIGEADFFQIQSMIEKLNEIKEKREKKVIKTLLCVFGEYLYMEEDGMSYTRIIKLLSAYKKCPESFVQILDGDKIVWRDDFEQDLVKEGYEQTEKSDELPYSKLISTLYARGVTVPPNETMSETDQEDERYEIQLWTKVLTGNS